MGIHILINTDNESDALGHLLGFEDEPRTEWAIQRPDGSQWQGSSRGVLPLTHRFGTGNPIAFLSAEGAQQYIDSQQRSTLHRAAFRDCVPAAIRPVAVEAGDHVICPTCGILHEGDYCATGAGHGVVL